MPRRSGDELHELPTAPETVGADARSARYCENFADQVGPSPHGSNIASSNTIRGALPQSSKGDFLKYLLRAHLRHQLAATSVEPVKLSLLRTTGLPVRISPIMLGFAGNPLNTPAELPASIGRSAEPMRAVNPGGALAGLSIMTAGGQRGACLLRVNHCGGKIATA